MKTWYDALVQAVGNNLGFSEFQCNAKGITGFDFENGDRLTIACSEEGMSLFLLRELDHYNRSQILEKSVDLCHYHNQHGLHVAPALHGDAILVFRIYLAQAEADLSTVDQGIQQLRDTMDIANAA